jgi:hypothetical protein
MKKLTREEMKFVKGGDESLSESFDTGECSTRKCADKDPNGGSGSCGGNSDCVCVTACIYCKVK